MTDFTGPRRRHHGSGGRTSGRRKFSILPIVSRVSTSLFRLSPAVRHVAVYRHGVLTMAERPNLRLPSSGESDRYEELLVNPAVLTLTEQRAVSDLTGRTLRSTRCVTRA